MIHTSTVSKTDLARQTRQIVDRARRGEAIIVESYGQEQVVVVDAIDYRILTAAAAYRMQSFHPTPSNDPQIEPTGLGEERVAYVVREAGGVLQTRWNEVVTAYLDGHINLGRAATLLGLSSYDLDERFRRLEIPRRIGPETIEEARLEVETALRLFDE